jgi:uncharacterized membrane protein (DUF485 family)
LNIFDYLQFIFAIAATAGSLFCCFGAFALNNKTIAFMSMGAYGPNQFAVKNIAEQRAQYIAGAIFFIFSFLVFIISIAFQDNFKAQNVECANLLKLSTMLAFVVIGIISYIITKWSATKTVNQIKQMQPELDKELMRLSQLAAEEAAAQRAS